MKVNRPTKTSCPDDRTNVIYRQFTTTPFQELLSEAVAIVKRAYPGSRLYEADGTSSVGIASKWSDVDIWTFLFLGPILPNQTTIVILEYRESKFSLPVLKYEPFPGEGVIATGLDQAIAFKNNAGKTEPFTRVHCHWPFLPHESEPFYIFASIGAPLAIVGGTSGSVTTPDARSVAAGKEPKYRCLDGPLYGKSRSRGARFYFDGRPLGREEGYYELKTVYLWNPIGPPSVGYSNDVLGLDVD